MNGDEYISIFFISDLCTLTQSQKTVTASGHIDAVSFSLECLVEFLYQLKNQLFLLLATTLRTTVMSTVTCINHHKSVGAVRPHTGCQQ
jgi:hypothetical protein